MVCVVSSSVLSAGSLVDHLSGTEGKYLSIASRKRALSEEDRSIGKSTGFRRADLHCFGVTMVGSPRAAPPRSLTHDSSFLSLHKRDVSIHFCSKWQYAYHVKGRM